MEELIKVSKLKLKLQGLVTELGQLREKKRVSSHQLHNHLQEQKQTDEDFRTKITQLEADLALSLDLRQKLQRKVQFLEDENYLLESKHKELKETINNILQAKEGFVQAYQESTCEMKRSIESKDRKIVMLSEKINAHLLSLDLIRKEASSVKQVVDNVQCVVNEKEDVVFRLKIEMDKVCASENLFIEKINGLEMKLKSNENELQGKSRVIAELQSQLEMTKMTKCDSEIDEHQETILMKEEIIHTLISENKALRSELAMLEGTLKTIQDTITRMDEEDRAVFSLMMARQEQGATAEEKEGDRINQDIQNSEANSHHEASRAAVADTTDSQSCKEHAHIASPLRENNNVNSCVSESTYSPSCSVHSESQPAANFSNVPAAEKKDNCNTVIQQLDSECSTTQA